MISEAQQRLKAIKDRVRLGMIGMQGGIFVGYTPIDQRAMDDAVTKFGVAQAIGDNISPDETGLTVRDILPDKDLLDKNAAAITKREWRWPWSGQYNSEEAEVQIYQTSRNSDNDRKVFIIYGVRLVGIFGPGRVGTETGGNVGSATNGALATSSLIFKRGNVKTIDIWQLEAIGSTQEGMGLARTPIMYKKNDAMALFAYPKTNASGSADQIMLVGKTIEPLSNNVTG